MTVVAKGSPCDQCGHPFDDHIMWADSTGDPLDGGTMTCPVVVDGKQCACSSVWGIVKPK